MKQGEGRFAWLHYGFEYGTVQEEMLRITKIYYYFDLYENSKLVEGSIIEGVFDNISPKVTKENWRKFAYSSLYP